MGGAGGRPRPKQALALGLAAGAVLVQVGSGLLRPGLNGMAQLSEMPLGLAHQFDEDFALATALLAKATHDLVQALAQLLCLLTQGLGRRRALTRD
jgi:hypothetical protein